ncbi:hypothetical protein RJ639_002215 [Escallonia herrerae]|uniref:Pentatricopeptide repeat-containing protein n=1 Tax=Escallonia herrerae TaxID=1293975 RepID=A0AA88X8G0_9ASTE|nr:hypothetical protein RJ639_002215 [Escallonia herrerae]
MPPILYPIPKPYMLLFPKKPQQPFSLSNCFLSSPSASCAALDTLEPSTRSPLCSTKNPSCQPFNMFEKVPTELPSPSWLKPKPSRTRAKSNFSSNGGIVVLDWKERLKWYSEVLKSCASSVSLREGRAVHGQVIKSGTDPDSHLWISLINFYEKCGVLDNACQAFDEMPERDVVSWTALIAGFVLKGHASEGVKLLCEMRGEGIRPNEFTLATALKACATRMDSKFGKQLHAEVIKVGVLPDVYVGSALVNLYSKCGEVEYADKVFSLMPEQNAVSWNALLNGYAQLGDSEQVLRLFCRMKEAELKFNKFTLSTVLKGCANSGDLRHGQLVHAMGVKIGCEPDIFIGCSLVDMYSKCGQVDDALKVFLTIKNPDIVTWSAMISCLDQQGKKQEAAELFHLMKHKGLGPNQFTLASLVSAATNLGDPLYCKSIHACVYKYGFDSEILLSNPLITMYMKIDLVSDSHQVFRGMSYWDVVSWNALLSGFHNKNTCDQGPRIFSQMLVEGSLREISCISVNIRTFYNWSMLLMSKPLNVGFD